MNKNISNSCKIKQVNFIFLSPNTCQSPTGLPRRTLHICLPRLPTEVKNL